MSTAATAAPSPHNLQDGAAAAVAGTAPPSMLFYNIPGGGPTGAPPPFDDAVISLIMLRDVPSSRADLKETKDIMLRLSVDDIKMAVIGSIRRQCQASSYKQRVDDYLTKNPPRATLTEDELLAIAAYSVEQPIALYKILNAWLSVADRKMAAVVAGIGPFYVLLHRALEKLPPQTVSANRGVKCVHKRDDGSFVEVESLMKTYREHKERCKPGADLAFWNFASFSTKDDVAGNSQFVGDPGEPGIVYSVGQLECVDISPFSLNQGEAEVLPLPPLLLKVHNTFMTPQTNKLIISCQQVQDPSAAYVAPRFGPAAAAAAAQKQSSPPPKQKDLDDLTVAELKVCGVEQLVSLFAACQISPKVLAIFRDEQYTGASFLYPEFFDDAFGDRDLQQYGLKMSHIRPLRDLHKRLLASPKQQQQSTAASAAIAPQQQVSAGPTSAAVPTATAQQPSAAAAASPPPPPQPRPSWCYSAHCPSCSKSFSLLPPQWDCPECKSKCWQPESAATVCKICSKSFGFFTRRHRCRRDGWVVCDDCSKSTRELPRLGFTGPQRVCSRCTEPQKGELFAAVQQGDAAKVRELLADREADANETGESPVYTGGDTIAGVPALFAAVFAGNFEITKLLLEHGADPNLAEPSEGRVPLMRGAAANKVAIVRLLLEHKADVNKTKKDGWSALLIAASVRWSSNVELVQLLLSGGADVNRACKRASGGWTPLLSAVNAGATAVVAELLQAGADTAVMLPDGTSAVYLAASEGEGGVLELLLRSGCNSNVAKKNGWLPLLVASAKGHTDCAAILLRAGADKLAVTRSGQSAVFLAAQEGHSTLLQLLLDDGCDPEASNQDGWRALHVAAARGHARCAAALLRAGADKLAVTPSGQSAVFLAAQEGHSTLLQLLLDAGCDTEASNQDGWRALHVAAARGHAHCAAALLRAGAKKTEPTLTGKLPLDIARRYEHPAVIKLFS